MPEGAVLNSARHDEAGAMRVGKGDVDSPGQGKGRH